MKSDETNTPVLEAKGIVKKYPGTVALRGIDFTLKRGEVRGLVGKNGAGKSTLIKIISGLERPTKGDIYIFGEKRKIRSVHDSESIGFRFVSQEPNLMEDLTVGENIAFRENELKRNMGLINWNKIYEDAKEKISLGGFELDPKTEVWHLNVSEKQMLLIIREIFSHGAKILALDEVTTSLTEKEKRKVYDLIRKSKEEGQSFIYVSHEISEIFDICDSVTVLRDGMVVLDEETKNLTPEKLRDAICGEELEKELTEAASTKRIQRDESEKTLIVDNISNKKLKNVSFDLFKGEILGVYGLRGAGKTELLKTIFGLMPVDKGKILFKGENIENTDPSRLISKGIGFAPEDRAEGLFYNRPTWENIVISNLKKYIGKLGFFLNEKKEKEEFEKIVNSLNIKVPSPEIDILYLSGGNQQKAMLGRCFATNSNLYLFDEVTRGIDVGAKAEIYKIIEKLALKGNSVIFTSSDMEETINISDRILILYQGRVTGIVDSKKATKRLLLEYAEKNEVIE